MTFSATPYALQNGSHSADLFRQATSSLVPPGGCLISSGDLAVTQTGTASMNVSVGVGRCWIPGTNVGNVAGGNFSSQAMYYGQNASAYTASVATSDPVNPRIDVVYAAVQDSQYAGSTNAGVIAVATGVPTSGATYLANAPALPANAIALAWIYVAANAASILNANITSLGAGVPGKSLDAAPKGLIGITDTPTNSPGLGGSSIMCDLTVVNLIAGRRYKLEYNVSTVTTTVANMGIVVSFLWSATGDSSATGTTIDTFTIWTAPTGNSAESAFLQRYYTPVSTGPVNIKVTMARLTTTDTYSISHRLLTVADHGFAV